MQNTGRERERWFLVTEYKRIYTTELNKKKNYSYLIMTLVILTQKI